MIGLGRGGVYIHNGILLSHKKEQNNAICSNMDGPRDSHTKWSKSKRERQIPYDITYSWNLIYGTNEPFHRKKKMHRLGEETCSCQGGWEGVGWTGNLGLIDANYCLWNELAMRSCCIVQGTISSHLWWNLMEDNMRKIMYVYMYDWVTLLCSRNWQNIVNQL